MAAKLQQQQRLVIKLVQVQHVGAKDWDTETFRGRKTAANSKLIIKLVQAQRVGAKEWDKVMLCNTVATAGIGL